MAKTISISFALSAALSGGFKGAFQGAAQSARNVTAAIRAMEKSPTGKLGAAMAQQREKIKSLSASLKEAKGTLAALQAKAQAAGGASGMLARQIALAQQRVNSLSGAMQRQTAQYRNTAAAAATQAGSVSRLSREYAELSRRMERARKVQGALAANRARGDALRAQRSDLNSRIAGTVAAAATVAVPAKLSIDFEQAIANVGAVANASDADLKRLTDTARQLGRDTMFSASEAAQGMKYLAMAGFDANRTIAAMPGLLNLAAAADTDLGRTADIASDILTAFGMKAEEMGDVGDTLAKAFTTSNTDLEMLGDTMKYVAPVAHALGMSLQDTAAFAGLMANTGIKASQGGTALRAALLRLAAPPRMAADSLVQLAGVEGEEADELKNLLESMGGMDSALQEIGMTTKDAAGNMRPFADVLEELNVRTAKMGSAEKAEVFKKVFGTEASAAMIALAEQAAKTVDESGNQIVDSLGRPTNAMRHHIEKINEYHNTSENIAKKRMNTTRGSLLLLSSAWQDAGISIGNLFLPAIRGAAGVLSSVANVISAFTERFPRLSKVVALLTGGIIALTAGALVLGLVLNVVKTAVNGVQGGLLRMAAGQTAAAASGTSLAAAETAAGAGARFFAGGLRSILIATGVGAALVGLSYAIMLLIDNWDAVVAAMSVAWNWIVDTWSRLTVFFTELGNGLIAIFPGIWEGVCSLAAAGRDAVIAVWEAITEFFIGIWEDVVGVASWAFDGVTGIWNTITGFFSGIVDSIFGVFEGLFAWLREKFAWVFESIDAVSSAIGAITGAVGKAWDAAFGSGGKGDQAVAENARKRAEKGAEKTAAQEARKAVEQPAAPVAKGAGKFTPVAREAVAAAGKAGAGGGRKSGGGASRKSGGGGGSSRNAASAATGAGSSGAGGPVTVVSLGSDNSKIQTIHIPAGQAAGKTAPMTATKPAAMGSSGAALPQAPGLAKKAAPSGAASSGMTIELNQKFDVMSEDPAAFRKVMESLKPDFERLVRAALEKMESDRRRTAYAQ